MEYLKDTLIYKIRGIRKKMLTASKRTFAGSNLTLELYVALHFIYENKGLTQKELADLIWNDANVVVRMVDKLEEMHFVHRERHAKDRRAYSLFITEDGERAVHTYWNQLIAYQEACLNDLNQTERSDFKRYLDIVLDEQQH